MSQRWSLGTMPAGGRQPNQVRSALVDAEGWEPWCTPGGGWEPWGTMPAGGRQPNQMRSTLVDAEGWEPWGTTGGIKNGSSSGSAAVHDVTVADEDIDILECGICYHPLKPPIFQCAKGHVVCSPCSKRLKDVVSCHVCHVAMPDGYQRCHAMECVVDYIRMPCPHAPYGCDKRTAYHARKEHLLECPHAPCHCPGDACGFVGSVTTLVTHLKATHSWPCTAEVWANKLFDVDLHIGFHFLTAVRGSTQYLLLLNMASTPFGHAISAVWISSLTTMAISSSSAPATIMTCELELYFRQFEHPRHYQKSRFQVECMCPSNGLPDPNASFQFFVPKYADGGNGAPVHVTATIFISGQADGSPNGSDGLSDESWDSWT